MKQRTEMPTPLILEHVVEPLNQPLPVLVTWTLPKNVFIANGDYLTFDLMVGHCMHNVRETIDTVRLRIGSENLVSGVIHLDDINSRGDYQIKGQIWRHSKAEAKAAVEVLTFPGRVVMCQMDGVPAAWDDDVTFTIEGESLPAGAGNYIRVEYFKAFVPWFHTISGYNDG